MRLEVPVPRVDAPLRSHPAEALGTAFGPIARHPIEGAQSCAAQPETTGEVAIGFTREVEIEVTRLTQKCALLVAGGLTDLIFERQRLGGEEAEHGVHDIDTPLALLSRQETLDVKAHDDHTGGLGDVLEGDRSPQGTGIFK